MRRGLAGRCDVRRGAHEPRAHRRRGGTDAPYRRWRRRRRGREDDHGAVRVRRARHLRGRMHASSYDGDRADAAQQLAAQARAAGRGAARLHGALGGGLGRGAQASACATIHATVRPHALPRPGPPTPTPTPTPTAAPTPSWSPSPRPSNSWPPSPPPSRRCNCTRSEATYYLESHEYAEEDALRAHSRDLAFERERRLLDDSIRERDAADAALRCSDAQTCSDCDGERDRDGGAPSDGEGELSRAELPAEPNGLEGARRDLGSSLGCFTQCLPPPPPHCAQSCAS